MPPEGNQSQGIYLQTSIYAVTSPFLLIYCLMPWGHLKLEVWEEKQDQSPVFAGRLMDVVYGVSILFSVKPTVLSPPQFGG